MTAQQKQFLDRAAQQAEQAGHLFPKMAACEAALESGFGTSGLSIRDNNLFGTKQHVHPVYGTENLPTKEFINGQWINTTAAWVKYPDQAACFSDRMDTLRRLASNYPHYKAALAATDPVTYVTEVSKTWSTDPMRAAKIIDIYNRYIAQVGNEA